MYNQKPIQLVRSFIKCQPIEKTLKGVEKFMEFMSKKYINA